MDNTVFVFGVFVSLLLLGGLILTVSEFKRLDKIGPPKNPRDYA